MVDRIATTLDYHERTKHHLNQYARSSGHLDWENQPDPFRTYPGAPVLTLPLLADGLPTSYDDLFLAGAVAPLSLSLTGIALLFELALGLSAWKQYQGSQWALRCNPSSGNLHPTEGYCLTAAVTDLPAGLYHYVSRDHALELRAQPVAETLSRLLPPDTALVGLTSIHWREAWKYGERAYRYCQHDAGHAIATVRYAAAALGWTARLLEVPSDADLAQLLGISREAELTHLDPHDREHPDALLLVGPAPAVTDAACQAAGEHLDALVEALRTATWSGRPNPLSSAHVAWDIIDAVAAAAAKPRTPPASFAPPAVPALGPSAAVSAAHLIRARRSAVRMDGRTSISVDRFYRMLDGLVPRPGVPPWDVIPWSPLLHCALFVHRVEGLPAGLYILERDRNVHERLKAALDPRFLWDRPPGCPDHIHLTCAIQTNCQDISRLISCHQEIASDGAFSLGMLADYEGTITSKGPWWYRRLFWEAGILGQVLYLEAEAAGVRATGIGCYFDDVCHDQLGLVAEAFQDLYHFTVGGPTEDRRLTTLPPYAHRVKA